MNRIVSVVVDNDSWFLPHAHRLVADICADGDDARLCRAHADIPEGDIAFYLSCIRITPPEVLGRNKVNLVVHASDLPKGRGFSPVAWQVAQGCNDIPLCLLHAVDGVDAGPVVYRDHIHLVGHELLDEIHVRQAEAVNALCLRYLRDPEPPPGTPQSGEPSVFPRRTRRDDELDVEQSLAALFDRLRVADNDKFPAYFRLHGHTYLLRITKE